MKNELGTLGSQAAARESFDLARPELGNMSFAAACTTTPSPVIWYPGHAAPITVLQLCFLLNFAALDERTTLLNTAVASASCNMRGSLALPKVGLPLHHQMMRQV